MLCLPLFQYLYVVLTDRSPYSKIRFVPVAPVGQI